MAMGWFLITFADNTAILISGRTIEGFSRSLLATSITVSKHTHTHTHVNTCDSLTLREDYKLQVLGNRVFMKIVGSKEEEVSEKFIILYNGNFEIWTT
jgi:hypothetical protein